MLSVPRLKLALRLCQQLIEFGDMLKRSQDPSHDFFEEREILVQVLLDDWRWSLVKGMDKREERAINDPGPAAHGRVALGTRVAARCVWLSDHQGRAAGTIAADTISGHQIGGSLYDGARKHAHRNVAASLSAHTEFSCIIRQASGLPRLDEFRVPRVTLATVQLDHPDRVRQVKTKLPHRMGEMRHSRRGLWCRQEEDGRRVILSKTRITLSQLGMQLQARLRPPVTTARWSRRHETPGWQARQQAATCQPVTTAPQPAALRIAAAASS